MKHTILICGYGPGISHAVASRFGKAGHRVALVARNTQRLSSATEELTAEGIQVRAFSANLNDIKEVKRVITTARSILGPIGILHWNAFFDIEGSLLSTLPSDLSKSFDIRVTSYIAAVQECLSDLEAHKGAVLTTSGIMALDDPAIDIFATEYAALAISVAAQHKTTKLLAYTLALRDIHVSEVIVNGFVEKTLGGIGKNKTIAPADIAEQFWNMYTTRQTHSVIFGSTIPVSEIVAHE
ncbi:putative short-chain dehydrogenase/reductase SDR [Xenorhabdus bovienii str. oregonense]|uniref:Putative short-chain dehydrogenase/reductase SDR n=1 Tax=Xenorhabdus bovienii str. oregonense TaxID=1398202 RepID=A0A077P895_XENBV|nr:SDR family NAD(P)-dependent oxidoreductase [Xenorhabdus bovienii]CDH06748.1 putative short-chain dehydrogenase/reductase SDR [Xenorhabdus bovienii str. oregonense]